MRPRQDTCQVHSAHLWTKEAIKHGNVDRQQEHQSLRGRDKECRQPKIEPTEAAGGRSREARLAFWRREQNLVVENLWAFCVSAV